MVSLFKTAAKLKNTYKEIQTLLDIKMIIIQYEFLKNICWLLFESTLDCHLVSNMFVRCLYSTTSCIQILAGPTTQGKDLLTAFCRGNYRYLTLMLPSSECLSITASYIIIDVIPHLMYLYALKCLKKIHYDISCLVLYINILLNAQQLFLT